MWLGQLLVATGKLNRDQVTAALTLQQDEGGAQHKRLGSILMELGLATMDDIRQALAQQHKQLLWCPRCQLVIQMPRSCPRRTSTANIPPSNSRMPPLGGT